MKPIQRSISHGILNMIAASFLFGIMTAFAKLACQTFSSAEVVFFRSLAGTLIMGVLLIRDRESFIGKEPRLLFLRGLFGFIALAMNFYGISQLNLGTAVILNFTSPIFVAIIAGFYLKEKISFRLWLLTIVCFSGVYLLVGPQFSFNSFPIMIGLISGVMSALAYVTISIAAKDESSYLIIFYFSFISMVGAIPLMWNDFKIPIGSEWIGILGVGLTASTAQIFLTKSVRQAPASVVCPFSYLTPIFSFLSGIIFWNEALTGRMVLGAVFVISSGVLIYILEKTKEPAVE